MLSSLDGVLIAPGFGQRGIEGKFIALKYAREHDIPTFGVCLGMQCMVIEYARDVLGYTDANSTEMDVTTKHNVIDLMEEQKSITNMGGTMRLGAYDCILAEDSIAAMERPIFANGIAIVSNLTMSIVKLLKMPECVAWARIPKLIWSKLSRFRLCVGMWEYNIPPSTIVRFLIRIPFSLTLLKQRFQKNNLVISKLKNG